MRGAGRYCSDVFRLETGPILEGKGTTLRYDADARTRLTILYFRVPPSAAFVRLNNQLFLVADRFLSIAYDVGHRNIATDFGRFGNRKVTGRVKCRPIQMPYAADTFKVSIDEDRPDDDAACRC